MKQDLSGAIEDYLWFRKSQDYSKGTLNKDRSVLRQFLATVGNIGTWQVTDRHVSVHFETAAKTRQPQTLRNDYNTLSKFFEWARHTKRMAVDNDPLFGRRRPRDVKRERNRIHVSQFPHLLDTAEARDPRDRALVAVLLYTLLRDGEASDLRIMDVDLEGGWLRARIHKTGVEDRIPICAELDSELRRWLTAYTNMVGPLQPMQYLLPPRITALIKGDGGRIVGHRAGYKPDKRLGPTGRLVTPILEDLGFPVVDRDGKPCGEGAHTIRRSGARALFDRLVVDGYDGALRIVQSLLHHKSVTQTELYLGLTADRRNRDDILRGKPMYGADVTDNVTPITHAM